MPEPRWPASWPPATPVGDEAYALIRGASPPPATSARPPGQLLIGLDPLSARRRIQALAALCDELATVSACYPGASHLLRYEVKPPQALHKRSPYAGSPEGRSSKPA